MTSLQKLRNKDNLKMKTLLYWYMVLMALLETTNQQLKVITGAEINLVLVKIYEIAAMKPMKQVLVL